MKPSSGPEVSPRQTSGKTPQKKSGRKSHKKPLSRILFVGSATLIVGLGVAVFAAGRLYPREVLVSLLPKGTFTRGLEDMLEPQIRRIPISNPIAKKIVAAAHAQEGDAYNASYRKISYPNGDVPKGGGACTDVVVRSLRAAGYDLQKLIHEDMQRDFNKYPKLWQLDHPDKNIDHRRVPNHSAFFERHGEVLPNETTGAALKTWLPGDIVAWKWGNGKWHTGVISDAIAPSGFPMVVHNGWMCTEQDVLTRWEIAGHYRFPKTRT